ncbi:MAG: nucleotide exchange factor GrpE, partial [Deltaproteobacteria bacterium]|nr:nucleotide exchange factor GrpE [Deltaproteobacteria bacterium]
LKEMETKIKSLEEEAKETYDRFLRVSAEFENYKKRSAREMSEFKKFANESLIKELLLVVDNMERAISSSKDEGISNNSLVEGVNMTLKELLKIFEKFGVKQVESLGKPFDPNFHQAVMQEETDEHPHNTVINELQKGYIINERLLRASTVVVSKEKK